MLQKSSKITIFMLAILIVYSIIANYSLVGYGFLYYFIVNPLFWIIFIISANFLCARCNGNTKLSIGVMEYTLVASLVYIGIYIFSEFFVDIGDNPYSFTIKGILINCIVYILPIIAKEYVRFKLINNVFEKDKNFTAVLVTIIFIALDIGIIDTSDAYNVTKLIFSNMLPIISQNILCTYIAYNKLWKPAVCYRVITFSYWLFAPILPKVTWIMTSVIDTLIPMVVFVYIRYLKKKKEIYKNQKEVEITNPKSIIPIVVVIVIILWFGMGIFPIKPVAIATGSMETTLGVGDVAILKKCNGNDIEIGDIVQYQKDNFTVIHRVISKYYDDGELFFITKGDNNKSPDVDPVSENQIISKELFGIKYIGYPAVFLNKINWKANPDTSSIEKGI